MPNCKQCQRDFEISEWDKNFYKKIDVPEPTLCPPCRQQRRMIWANQINLYKRKCDATGETIISSYHQDSPLKVYSQPHHISDEWEALDYGLDFDFTRPFFEQFYDLAQVVPRPALHTNFEFDENSDYTNYAGKNKNCYMLFDSDYDWDCYYGMGVNKSKNCMDCYRLKESELCYECIDCVKCYNLYYSQDCENCSYSAFLKNCIGVKRSFMCSNLKNKEYYIFNKPYDKETYEKLMVNLSKHSELQKYFKDWGEFKLKYPQKYMHGVQNENVIGDYVVYSKNSDYCFDSMELWDCKYFTRSFGAAKDCMDCDECGDQVERFYETAFCGYNEQDFIGCMFCFSQESSLRYCFYTHYSQNCFACVGLTHKKFCILNKQYSEDEYHKLSTKIIEHMKKTEEWGEFMPAKYSDFAYNESIDQEYYPLTKEEALAKGYRWRDPDKKEYLPATAEVPDESKDADKSICNELLACEICGRNYKIVDQEFQFYKQQGTTIPRKCFYCRHKARFDLRNKRILYGRNCDKCGLDIKTTYSPESKWTVYCERDYQESLQ